MLNALRATVAEVASRSPHGERGLKYLSCRFICVALLSLSSRRAWIEIFVDCLLLLKFGIRRSPHGERGLKFPLNYTK